MINDPGRSDPIRLQLGAYALGALDPADQRRVETHTATCAACRLELAELESVLPALATVTPADIEAPAPSPDLFARILTTLEHDEPTTTPARARRRRPPGWNLAVAATVVLLVTAGTVAGVALSASSSRPQATVAAATANGIRLHVTAIDAASGTRLVLTAIGLPRHERCHLVATAADGSRHPAGSWNADYDGSAKVTETTDVSRTQLRRLTLYGDNQRPLVTITV